jgi:hypothetical protein
MALLVETFRDSPGRGKYQVGAVVDPDGEQWVRFAVTRARVSPEKPHGLDYSLTLHGPDGERLVGFSPISGTQWMRCCARKE